MRIILFLLIHIVSIFALAGETRVERLKEGVLTRKILEDQKRKEYKMELKNGLTIQILNLKTKKNTQTASEGGWQPETAASEVMVESAALEIVKMAAQEQCSGVYVMTTLADALGANLEGVVLNISSLPENIKTCLDQ